MTYLKLSNEEGLFTFTLEEIDEILKLKFHAKECSNVELHKQKFFSEKAVREKTYAITDENIIEHYTTSEEKDRLQECIAAKLARNDDPLNDIEMGNKYIINLEIDSNDKIVYAHFTGNYLSYFSEEISILLGNDHKSRDIYKENINENNREEIEQLLKEADKRYISLLKKHGYIK